MTLWDTESGETVMGTCRTDAPRAFCSISEMTLDTKYWASIQRWMPDGLYSEHSARVLVYPRAWPDTPTNLAAALVGNDIQVSWTGVADPFDAPVESYTVGLYRSTGPNSTTGRLLWAPASDRTLVIPVSDQWRYEEFHGEPVWLTIMATNAIGEGRESDIVSLSALPLTATDPVLTSPKRTADGFSVEVTNEDTSATYTATATPGTAQHSGNTFAVTGLAPGDYSTLSVVASKEGYFDGISTSWSQAGLAAVPAKFSAPAPTMDGYTVTITNFDDQMTYDSTVSLGSVARHGSVLTVSGLTAGTAAALKIQTSRSGWNTGTSYVSGMSLRVPSSIPNLSEPVSTPDGFTATVLNHDAARTYRLELPGTGVATLAENQLAVTGLAPNRTATLKLYSSNAGEQEAHTTLTGSSLLLPAVPFTLSEVTPTADGWTAKIVDYATLADANTTFSVQVSEGTATLNNGVVTVSGLSPNRFATATVSLERTDTQVSTTTAQGTSLNSYTVTWNENWSGADTPEIDVIYSDRLDVLPDPSAAGWVITEWNTTPDCSGTTVNLNTSLASVASGHDVTLYAIWEQRTLSLALSKSSVSAGETVTVSATTNAPFGQTDVDATDNVLFTSSKKDDVVSGSAVTATSSGERTLTGEFDGGTATANLSIVAGPLANLALTPSATTADQGGHR